MAKARSKQNVSFGALNLNMPIGIFIDLSKAFDTIDHNIMLEKLDCYGIRGTAHDLISNYLTSRKQCTKFMDEVSDLKMILYGVPQGSVLGPLLFLVYINDIVNCCSLGEFILYQIMFMLMTLIYLLQVTPKMRYT